MNILFKVPGFILVFLGAITLSFGGLIVKSFDGANLWQILFWRSVFFCFVIIIFLSITYKRQFFKAFINSGLPGVIGGIILGSVHTYTEAQIGAVLITIGGLIGIVYDFTNNHETIAFKEYKKIKSINNVDEKEKLAYQSLVFLAEKSIQKRNNKDREKQNTSGLNPLTAIVAELFKMKLKEMKALTPEQKLLNNYLEQKPL